MPSDKQQSTNKRQRVAAASVAASKIGCRTLLSIPSAVSREYVVQVTEDSASRQLSFLVEVI